MPHWLTKHIIFLPSFLPSNMADLVVPFAGFAYHPHQVDAIQWMKQRESMDAPICRGGILADEMGLGKTWMTIGLMYNAPVAQTLLLVPPVLQPQWSEALQRSSIPHKILSAPSTKGAEGCWRYVGGTAGFSVILSTYTRAMNYMKAHPETPFVVDRVICDEGHVLRSGMSIALFRSLKAVAAERKWILSGTPVQNSKYDFINLVRFCGGDDKVLIQTPLAVLAETVLLRRTVSDVRDVVTTMPTLKPTHIVHPVVMPDDSEEERVFAALVGRFNHAVEANANASIVLELYLRIRQFLAHPAIYVDAMLRKYGDSYGRKTWTSSASKVAAFEKLLSTTAKENTIAFGTFRQELDHASTRLRAAGYDVWEIRGGLSDAARERIMEESKAAADLGKPVALVVQIIAGGAGLNLQHCSRIVFLSSHWNPAVVDQAIARAYRMGQDKHVTVHHLLMADDAERNIDRRMAQLHGSKRGVAVGIHAKLFCDSAVSSTTVLSELDGALPEETVVMGAAEEEDDE